jgi:hypothetical protein
LYLSKVYQAAQYMSSWLPAGVRIV